MKFFDTSNLRGDIYGGLTAGVVALPLALAFGEASGAGPIAGLWGAIIVGFFASLFGGTGAQITGPTGPMVVVFAGVFSSLSGDPKLVFAAVVLAGLIQIGFGIFKLGQYIRLVPYPVISGFMSGIGVIIIILQFARLFGHEPEGKGTIAALQAIPGAVADPNLTALVIGLLTLGIIFMWPKNLGKFVPGALAALIIGTVLSLFIPGAPVLGDLPRGLPEFTLPSLTVDTTLIIIEAAVILAALGAIDSLLTSLVADNMTRTRHNSDQELIGQGIGNTIAGLFGAIPGAGATMRTVVNIRTGGATKISGMLHSVALIIIALPLAAFASKIPHAVLAGILVKVGYDIIDVAYLRRAHKGPRWDLILMAVVLLLTVFVDLIVAVGVGVFLASLAFVKVIADEQLASVSSKEDVVLTSSEEQAILDQAKGRITLFDFDGPLSFGAAADLGHQFRERVKGKPRVIILDFSRMPFIDVSAARAVETIACDAKQANKTVYITGMTQQVKEVVTGLNADHCLPANAHFENRIDAMKHALEEIQSKDKADQEVSTSDEAPVPAE